jgi:hypothetical protein
MEEPQYFNLEYRSGGRWSSEELYEEEGDFQDEYRSTGARSNDRRYSPELDNGNFSTPLFPIDPEASSHEEYFTPPTEEERYLEALRKCADVIIGGEPMVALPADAIWSELWLSKAVFVFHTTEAQMRVRTIANLWQDINGIEDVLNLTIRFGIPLTLYLKEEDIGLFRREHLSIRELGLSAAMYEPGFVESPLLEQGSPESTYGSYTSRLDTLFARHHSGVFIAEGGILSWIAQLYAPDLVASSCRGPRSESRNSGEASI